MRFVDKYIEMDKTFYKRLLTIAIPVVLQSVITNGVNMVDNIMLGQFTEAALSGSTQANQFIMLFSFTIMGVSMGASVLSSRYWGAKDFTSLKKAVTIALRFGLALGLGFTLVDVFLPRQVMGLYFRPEAVAEIEAGVEYLRWSTATFLLMALSFALTNIMRSMDLSNVPLIASIFAFGVNVGANYVFIFGKLGFPKMGVAGAALGTVIARAIETGIIVGCFLKNKKLRYRLRDLFMPCGDLVMDFLRISIPVMLSDCLLGLGDNVLAIIMGQIGSGFVSANSITSILQRVSTIFISGLSFSGVYNITDETKAIARELMNALSIIVIFRSTNSILTKGVLRGGGDTRFLLMADMFTMWLIAVPLGALAGLVLHLPTFYTYVFLHADQIIKAIWCVFRLRSGKWIKKIKTETTE